MKRFIVASLFIVIVLSGYALAMADPVAESRRGRPLPY
uniref:Venom peptide n=1 Tax=Dasymutilla sicheliana TaxID=1175388 RepID=A0A8T9VT24_DASSI|nr:venom peptide precursor [Dasymutilla sicheliana]